MANTEEEKQTTETTEAPKPDVFNALDGIGIDVAALKQKADEEQKKSDEAKGKPPEAKVETEPKKEEPVKEEPKPAEKKPEETKPPEDYEFKVGEKVFLDDGKTTPEDGEYSIGKDQVAVVKAGKIEEIKKVEEEKKSETKGKEEFDNPFVSTEPETKVTEIKEFKDAVSLIKKELDIEVKELGDLNKVITQYKTLQGNLDKASADVKKLADWNQLMDNLPEEIYGVFDAFMRGEDYIEVMRNESRQKPDFAKDFASNSKELLLNYYYPGKFSTEDYQDEDKQSEIGIAMDSAQKFFDRDKKEYKTYRDQITERANQKTEAMKTSIETTINTLKKDVPYIKDNHKKRIEGIINLGPSGVMSLFVNEDGTFKPEAGKLVSLAVYGEDAINFHKDRAAKDAETETTEQILQRGTGDKQRRLAPAKIADTREDDVKKKLGEIIPDMGGRTIFSRKYAGTEKK